MDCEVLPARPDLLPAHRGEAGGAERRWSCVCAQGGCGMYCMASQLVGALLCTPLYLASGGCCLGYCQGAAAPPCHAPASARRWHAAPGCRCGWWQTGVILTAGVLAVRRARVL